MNDYEKAGAGANNVLIVILSLVVSVWIGLICEPGLFYTDSFSRWDMALFIADGVPQGETMLSVMPQLFMALCYKFTNSFFSYTILQSFLFYCSIFALLDCFKILKQSMLRLFCVLLVFFPVFQAYSVFIEPSIGVITAVNFLLVFVLKLKSDERISPTAAFCVFSMLFAVMFGYRQNTLTILPVIIVLLWVYLPKVYKYCGFAAIICALIFVTILPDLFKLRKVDNYAQGPAWEIICMLEMLDKEQYSGYLDYAGNTQNAIKNNSWQTMHGSLSGSETINPAVTRARSISKRVLADYVRLIKSEPLTFIKMKLRFWSRTLGFNEPILNMEIYKHSDGVLEDYGYRKTYLNTKFVDDYNEFMERMSVLRRPYLLYLSAALLIFAYSKVYRKRLADEHLRFMLLVYAIAVFYYMAFMITTQSQEFRYFFPSFVLLFLLIIAIIGAFGADLAALAVKKLPQRMQGFEMSRQLKFNWVIILSAVAPLAGITLYGVIMPKIITRDVLLNGISKSNGFGAIVSYDRKRNVIVYNINNPGISSKANFFLHIYEYPEPYIKEIDDDSFINFDYYANRPGNIVALPKINILKIKIGQFNDKGRIWEQTLWKCPTAIPANLANTEWDNGISLYGGWYRSKNVVLFENNERNSRNIPQSGKVILADGIIRQIDNIERDDKWIRLFLSGPGIEPACGYPNAAAFID